MTILRTLKAIGLMSGTSIDGVDAALIETDGVDVYSKPISLTRPYEPALKEGIRSLLGDKWRDDEEKLRRVEALLTLFHKEVVTDLLAEAGQNIADIDVIGFHGHTLLHNPALKITRQIGNPQLLANELKTKVVSRFRNIDIKSGGQGAPLEAAYLVALTDKMPKPVGVINIGGVANITIIGANGNFMAFHTGPGNALIDDWMRKRYGIEMDFDGLEAAKGSAYEKIISVLLQDKFFTQPPPKSIDRNFFAYALKSVDGLSVADGAATLTAFTAAAIADGVNRYVEEKPLQWIVYGGGAYNPTLVHLLRDYLGTEILRAEDVGWNGCTLEAQSFAYLAVRSLFDLPLTFPATTGVSEPLKGGKLFIPEGVVNNAY